MKQAPGKISSLRDANPLGAVPNVRFLSGPDLTLESFVSSDFPLSLAFLITYSVVGTTTSTPDVRRPLRGGLSCRSSWKIAGFAFFSSNPFSACTSPIILVSSITALPLRSDSETLCEVRAEKSTLGFGIYVVNSKFNYTKIRAKAGANGWKNKKVARMEILPFRMAVSVSFLLFFSFQSTNEFP